MTRLPQCSDLAKQGYTPEAIKVIQADGKCGDENGIPLRTSSTQTNLPGENLPSDPLVIFGFMLGAALVFGSTVWELLGVSKWFGRGKS
ncbi:MAG: hypothetical protein QNJ46_05705 [Leptolyngbyaceae cyanobacterium MO_188.B28]|nr:hypothetical protein [Leptolyngbyaceae cyanobacterium MO_188.B28]